MEGGSLQAPSGRIGRIPPGLVLGTAAALAVLATAYALGSRGGRFPIQLIPLAAAFPAAIASVFLAARRPAWGISGAFLLMAFAGTLAANGVVRASLIEALIWLLLLGLLAAMVAGHLNATASRGVAVWPGIVALAAYLAFTALQIPFAETTEIGLRAFLDGPAFIFAFFTLAYSQWRPEVRWRIAKAFAAVALVVGAYALFRLVVGPTGAEEAVERSSGRIGGELALIGSFGSRLALGAWSAVAIPFLFSLTVANRGRGRMLSAAALVLMLVGLLGSEVRTALVGAALGILVATALFQAARAFRGMAGVALLAAAALGAAGILAFALTVGTSSTSTERFESILNPGQDYSFQQRTKKWDLALADINTHPFGEGLGTTGTTQREYSHTIRIDNRYIDNSYLQLGVQQGYPGWILFGLSVTLIGYMLVRSSIATRDRHTATLGIGAAASLATWLVVLTAGDGFTSWGALLLWMLLGLGVGGLVTAESSRARLRPD